MPRISVFNTYRINEFRALSREEALRMVSILERNRRRVIGIRYEEKTVIIEYV